MIPWQLKDAVRQTLAFPQRQKARRVRAKIEKALGNEPVVAFGGILDQPFIHGGAVKLLALRQGFAHDERRFNLLYLVSSALPEFAEDLVADCEAREIPLVWNQNGVAYPAWAGSESERYNGPMRRLRARANFVVYQSDFCRGSADQFLGSSDRPQATLFNPVNLAQFCPGPALPPNPLRLLAAGTHGYRERVTSTLETLEKLLQRGLDATLTIAGKLEWPGAGAEIAAEIESRRLPVQLVPPFSQEQAVTLYQAHHLLLHPKYLDPCPTVVAEALACGLPVIGSDSGGLPEMTSPESSRLIPAPRNWTTMHTPSGAEMADAIFAFLPRLHEASRAARARAEALFDRTRWVEAHREIFYRVLCE